MSLLKKNATNCFQTFYFTIWKLDANLAFGITPDLSFIKTTQNYVALLDWDQNSKLRLSKEDFLKIFHPS